MSSYAVGIDLGTTYSCVAVYRQGKVEIIPNNQGNKVMPSFVAFNGAEILVGERAKGQIRIDPRNTVFDAKRLIGRNFHDAEVQNDLKYWPFKVFGVDGAPRIEVTINNNKQIFTPEQISAKVLQKLKKTAEDYLQVVVKDAVITVPAYFNNAQRKATKHAAEIAGLNVLALINEPTAAAFAYGLDKKDQIKKNVLIFDIGGGTLDVSVLRIGRGEFEVKATTGDSHLGGQDFDNCLLKYLMEDFAAKHHVRLEGNIKAIRRLKLQCEKAKHILSDDNQADIEIDCLYNDIDYFETITRDRFEELNRELFVKAMDAVIKVLKDAKFTSHDIEDVVLIGGSSRIPKIQQLLRQIFHDKRFVKNINPDEAVAYGAAVHAAHLYASTDSDGESAEEYSLIEVTPLSLGVGVTGGLMSVVVERNTQVPCNKKRNYTTVDDNQTSIKFTVYEGERQLIKDNRRLGQFVLTGIPKAPRKVPSVNVTFEIDRNGILKVSAIDQKTGKSEMINIDYGSTVLTEFEVACMIRQAKIYESEDKKERERIQSKLNFSDYLYKMKKIHCNPHLFSKLLTTEKMVLESYTLASGTFLKENQNGSKADFDYKLENLKIMFDGIMKRVGIN